MGRFRYLLFSVSKGKILPQIFCIFVVGVLTFVLLITLGGFQSYKNIINSFNDPVCDSVIWSDNVINYWGLNKGMVQDDIENLIDWQYEEYGNIEEISNIVKFDCNYGYFDSADNSVMIVRNNDYFKVYSGQLFGEYLSENQNKAVLSSSYKNEYEIGDTIQLCVINTINEKYEYVSLIVEVVDFCDCYIMNGTSIYPQLVDIITSDVLFDCNGNCIISPKEYQDTSCIFLKDECELSETIERVRTTSIAPHQLWTSNEREFLYRESVLDPFFLLIVLSCFCFTFVFIVIFSKNILFLNYRKREIAIQCLCGATFNECILYSIIFEFILVILGYISGLKWYKESFTQINFVEPLTLSFSIEIVVIVLLILMVTTISSALFATSIIKKSDYPTWLCKE